MANFLNSIMQTTVKIPRNSSINGVTYYDIQVKIDRICWTVKRRYREFVDLNEKLISDQSISRDLLPPKKVIGNRCPTFLEQRQNDLEKYLQEVLRFLQLAMCREFIEFLDFHKYDIIYLLQDLAEIFYNYGESRLLTESPKSYTFSALEMHAISERLKLPCPVSVGSSVKNAYDFSHVIDVCSQLDNIIVRPTSKITPVTVGAGGISMTMLQYQTIGSSNLVPKNLRFDFAAFRNIQTLRIDGLTTENIFDAGILRENLQTFIVQNSGIEELSTILLCDCIHRTKLDQLWSNDQFDKTKIWTKLKCIDFSANSLHHIDACFGTLVPKLQQLNLNNNQIQTLANLNGLPYLNMLNLCENQINECVDCHLMLGNLTVLNLSQNHLKSLYGFRKMYSLVTLNVASNQIKNINEVDHLSALPCLEELSLTGNPFAAGVDYRPRVLSRFGDRCNEILLDNEKGGPHEIDTALVLAALRTSELNSKKSNCGKSTRISSSS